MLEHHVETSFPCPADPVSRRRSLASLAGAALAAAFAAHPVAEAKKGGKKGKKKNKNKKQGSNAGLCEEQLQPCRVFVDDFCALFNPPGPPRDACVAGAIVCCEPITECDGEGVFDCLFQRISSI